MNDKTGGQAFPVSTEYGPKIESAPVMTLRDYFAAKAMQGIVSGVFASGGIAKYGDSEILSDAAYSLADNMLKARDK